MNATADIIGFYLIGILERNPVRLPHSMVTGT